MGFWSKVKNGIDTAKTVAPMLPIPAKFKRVIAKVGETEEDVEAIVNEVKPTKPAVKTVLPLVFVLLCASSASAQVAPLTATHTFEFEAPANVTTIAEALTFEPRFTDGGMALAPVTGMTCAAATAPATGITCRVPLGAANASQLNRLGPHTVTVALFRADVGIGNASVALARPTPAGAPTGLRLQP